MAITLLQVLHVICVIVLCFVLPTSLQGCGNAQGDDTEQNPAKKVKAVRARKPVTADDAGDVPEDKPKAMSLVEYDIFKDPDVTCARRRKCTCSSTDEVLTPGIGMDACKERCMANENCLALYCQSFTLDMSACTCHEYPSCESTRTPSNKGAHWKKASDTAKYTAVDTLSPTPAPPKATESAPLPSCPEEVYCTLIADVDNPYEFERCCPRGDLVVVVNAVNAGQGGSLRAYILDSKSAWDNDVDNDYSARYSVWLLQEAVKSTEITFTFAGLLQTEYAVMVVHDKNNNGELDTNFLGIPQEGVTASNEAKGGPFGGPKYAEAKFWHEKSPTKLILPMWYM